jgi:Spy/CpxP family protein refolding chaperone
MRKLMAVLTLSLAAATVACDSEPMAPLDDDVAVLLGEVAGLAFGSMEAGDGGGGPGIMERLSKLPPEIGLSDAQASSIRAMIETFVAATAADRQALTTILQEAAQARQAGKTAEEVRAILVGGAPIRERLRTAQLTLHRSILAALTPAQRAWLMNGSPPTPRPCALTDAQRTEISALRAAFEESNAADIALLRSVHQRAHAAREAGASREAVVAILAEGREAVERLRAARIALHAATQAVLTPEQQAAGCFR